MADIFGNIFEDEENDGGGGVTVTSSVKDTQSPSSGGAIFDEIFKEQPLDAARDIVTEAKGETKEKKEDGFLKTFGRNVAGGAKIVGKWGLDLWNKQSEKNDIADFKMREMMYGDKELATDPETGKRSYVSPRLQAFESATTDEERAAILHESNQDVPIIKFFNSKAGKATISTISEKTSNIPLKTMARIQAIGDNTYEEAYGAWLDERDNPDNPTWQKFLFELQDTGVQSGLGILLTVGVSAATRNPKVGVGVSSAYYTALSADEQLQSRGEVESIGNIVIDVVGDQLINKALLGVIGGGSKGAVLETLKGFGIEGSTEVAQSLLKYTNDYGNARTDKEREDVLREAEDYVKNGGMAMEFAVGGTVGGIATGIGAGFNASSQPNDATTKKGGTPKEHVPNTSPVEMEVGNTDIDAVVKELVGLEQTLDVSDEVQTNRVARLRDTLNDYTTAFKDKTVFVPSEVTNAPLVEVVTSTLPSGKVVVKFSANTKNNSFSSEFDYSQLFETQEAATKSAQDAIIAWANSQESTDVDEQAAFAKVADFAADPRSPVSEEAETKRTSRQAIQDNFDANFNAESQTTKDAIAKVFKGREEATFAFNKLDPVQKILVQTEIDPVFGKEMDAAFKEGVREIVERNTPKDGAAKLLGADKKSTKKDSKPTQKLSKKQARPKDVPSDIPVEDIDAFIKWKGKSDVTKAYHGSPYIFDTFQTPDQSGIQSGAYPVSGISFATEKSNAEPFSRQFPESYYDSLKKLREEYKGKKEQLKKVDEKVDQTEILKELNRISPNRKQKRIETIDEAHVVMSYIFDKRTDIKESAREKLLKIANSNEKELRAIDEEIKAKEKELENNVPAGKVYEVYIKHDSIVEEKGEDIGFGSTRDQIVDNLDENEILRIEDADTGQYIREEIIVRDPKQVFLITELAEKKKTAKTKDKKTTKSEQKIAEDEKTADEIVEYVDQIDRSVDTEFVRDEDAGILDRTKQQIKKSKVYVLKTFNIDELIKGDKDLKEYTDANEQRYPDGEVPEAVELNLDNPIVVGIGGEVIDGYNRILTLKQKGVNEIQGYGVKEEKPKVDDKAVTSKKVSTEPQKAKKKTVVKKTSQEKRSLIKEVAGERITQRKAKAIYNKGTTFAKGDYKGGTFTTNRYILEFSDVDGVETTIARDKVPTQEAIETAIISKLGDTEVSKANKVIRNNMARTAVIVSAGEQDIAIDLDYYNYFTGKYPTADWKSSDKAVSPVGLYEGKKLVAVVMPFADTEGKTLENLKKGTDEELDTSFKAVAKNQGVDEALNSVEHKELKKRGRKLKNNNDPKEGVALGKKTVKDYKPSGVASAVFSSDQVQGGGQPEKAKADIPIELGQMNSINPIEMPELVELARELLGGQSVQVTKLRGGKGGGLKLGDFMPAAGGRIRLADFLFKQENLPEAAKTLAHELGHLIDYLPSGTLARGNLLGRLSSLRGFMQATFSFEEGKGLPPKDRTRIRNEAKKEVAAQLEKPQKDFTLAEKRKAKDLGTKRIQEAIKSGGFITDAKVRKELLTVSRWWKPYNPQTAPPQFKAYRESSVELYADAISVLFNAPRRLQDIAPTFYEGFFKGLDAKPEVKDAYFELQALLSGDRELVVKKRREGVKKMFKDGDKDALDLHNKEAAERENRQKQYWSHFKHTVIDKNFQIIDRVKKAEKAGKKINPDDNPVFFLEERNYLGGKIKAVFEREFNTIYNTLNENEITWADFGEVLFYERIAAGDRSDVANPRGITPEAATELLDTVKKEYGAERWAIIQEQVENFRKANRTITEDAFKAGLYKKELYDMMQENPAYVTFQVLDHLEEGMNSRVYKSLGTLKDITNPADATMLKVISTIRASERNVTTKKTVDFLKESFPEDIVEANYSSSPKGRFPMPSKLKNQELVMFMEEGVTKGYYVDPYIADTINNQSVGRNAPIVPVIRFMNTKLFRPLFISFNLGFQSFNLIRDFVRFYKNTPDMTFLRAMKRYGQSARTSKIRAFGLPKNPSQKDQEAFDFINKLEQEKILSVTFNDMIKGETTIDQQVERILADTGIKEFQPVPTIEKLPKFAKPVAKLLNKVGILDVASNMLGFIENLGNLIETLPKAAGIIELTQDGDLTIEEKSFVRRKIGSPDFLAGGTYKPITNEVFLFSNAIIQGIRSDIEVATDPVTRSGWWWKTAKITFLPKLMMMAVLYGLMGDEYKELMEGASEYDKTNYIIIPLGRDSNGKPIYFRMPQDEGSRFLGGVFWKALTIGRDDRSVGRDIADVFSYTGGQLPTISPAVSSISATAQFLSGQNPYDFFRGRPAISETTFKAGGLPATKAFLGWQFQQLGGGIFYRFYHEPSAKRETGSVEKFFNAPVIGNVLGRFVRVSDFGEVEKLRNIEDKVEKEKAKETLEDRELINKYIDQAREKNIRFSTATLENELVFEKFGGSPTTKEEVSEAKSIVKKFQLTLRRGNADPNVSFLVTASSNDVKLEILKKLQEDMDSIEFNALRRDLISSKIVSKEVFNKLITEGTK